jgi:signal transduction histidine kinase
VEVLVADERSMLDALPEAVIALDDAGRISLVNDRASCLLGVGADSVGRHLTDVLDLRDDSGAPCELATEPPRVGDRLAERVLRLHDGDRVRPVAIAGRWRDGELVLTARSAGRREMLDAVHGDVVATVSHEIRSPLTSVKGFTRTMLNRWDRFSDEQKRAMLETIDADADRVTRLLKELLDVSRIDAGRVQLRPGRVDLTALAERVVDRIRQHDETGERELTVTEGVPIGEVLVDADKLEQILVNLVENAVRYAPEGPVRVHLDREGDRLLVTVRDVGPGVDADQRRVIFQKFGRGRGVRRAGTGLGLYITRGLVEAHGGDVEVVDHDGNGAVFRVDLPYVPVGPG